MSDLLDPGRLLGAIFTGSPDAIVVVDDAGTIVLSSPAVAALFGYLPEELVGTSVEVLIPTDRRSQHEAHLRAFVASPRSRQMGDGIELAGRHRDGSIFAVEISLTPVEVSGKQYVAAFVRDGRERQRGIDRLRAVNEITQRLLAGADLAEILPLVAQRARQLSRSDAVWIVTPVTGAELEISVVDGPGADRLLGVTLSGETSRSAEVMRTGKSEAIADLSEASNVPPGVLALELGPGLYVPLVADERRMGTLVLARTRGARPFEPVDVAFAEVFASSTVTAIKLGEVRSELEHLGIVTEDERIARDLHDTVIQQLFAIGMSLQMVHGLATGIVGERIDDAVDRLDGVIREVRNTIFRLPNPTSGARGLREEVLNLAERSSQELGFAPRVAFDGPVDVAVPDVVRSHLLRVFGEALSNIARHAQASSAEAVIAVADGWLSLSVIDDGIGIADEPTAGQGLRNMAARASSLGGSCSVRRREPSGTILEWRVPV